MKIVTTEEMRDLESLCAKVGLTSDVLMEKAGAGVAVEVRKVLGQIGGRRVLILVGPGNNGGDGLVAARHLSEWGLDVRLYFGDRKPDSENTQMEVVRRLPFTLASDDVGFAHLAEEIAGADIVVDALFGTGMNRSILGYYHSMLKKLNEVRLGVPHPLLVAVDLPSGLNGDTGEIDEVTPYADVTLTLGCPKFGLFSFPGAARVGKLTVIDIGIPFSFTESLRSELLTPEWVRTSLPSRPGDANKGTFGALMVLAGSVSYPGAAYLACSGALRVGTGLVTLAVARSIQFAVAAKLTEATYLPLPEIQPEIQPGILQAEAAEVVRSALTGYNVLLAGCGLGQNSATVDVLRRLFLEGGTGLPSSVVIDADGLNFLSTERRWWDKLKMETVVTPHPGEMARLCGLTVAEVQKDRQGIARSKAEEWQKTVVLKGAYSIVATPDGRMAVSPFANAGLASAGTGDVLAGVIAGLLAQGLSPFRAACCGVYLHGEAGERVKQRIGDAGMLAGDLPGELPLVIKELR